jgi:RHS repeat-associated protein
VPASFVYDAAGRRSRKTINGLPTDFLYDAMNPIQEHSGSTTTDRLTGLSMDEYFRESDATNTAFVIGDALGSVLAITDGSGNLSTIYTYEPFGATTATGTATPPSHDFTGRESDAIGMKYYRARYYHPVRQRFMSEDPIGLGAGDTNFYAYVRNNPVMYVDPTGLCDDPGGLGLRYCIDRFISARSTIGFWGDNRRPVGSGPNTYRMRITVSEEGIKCRLGDTAPWVGPWRQGIRGAEVHGIIPRPLGGRKIFFHCEGWNGWTGPGLSPGPIVTIGTIVEDARGNVLSISLGGTPYPAAEVWQYGSAGGQPVLLGQYPASGTSPWNLNLIGPIPLR